MLWIFLGGCEACTDLERETGIEPATNGLGSRYSTIELLPLQSELYPWNRGYRLQRFSTVAISLSGTAFY
jgi:hypothetical protein